MHVDGSSQHQASKKEGNWVCIYMLPNLISMQCESILQCLFDLFSALSHRFLEPALTTIIVSGSNSLSVSPSATVSMAELLGPVRQQRDWIMGLWLSAEMGLCGCYGDLCVCVCIHTALAWLLKPCVL